MGQVYVNLVIYSFFFFISVRVVLEAAQAMHNQRSSTVQDTTSTWWRPWREILCHVTPMYTGTVASHAI